MVCSSLYIKEDDYCYNKNNIGVFCYFKPLTLKQFIESIALGGIKKRIRMIEN